MSALNQIKKGAFWVLLFSVINGPLALLRNWLMIQYDTSGTYLGDFAIVMILFNLIISFLIFGGNSVLTNLVPKIDTNKEKGGFLKAYTFISGGLLSIIVILLLLFPSSIEYITNGRLNKTHNIYIVLLSVPVLISQILIYFLQGIFNYKISSILNILPNIINTVIVFVLLIFHIPKNILNNGDTYINFLSFILIVSCVLITVFALLSVQRYLKVNLLKADNYLPNKFWSFSIYVHLLTIITFFYSSIDQVFVLSSIDVRSLGYYYIIIQLVEVVRFIPLRIGQVLLASFSKLIHDGDTVALKNIYNKISKIIIALNLILSCGLMLIAREILIFYKIEDEQFYTALILLLVAYNISALGNINSMAVLAKDLARDFFINNLIVVIVMMGGMFFWKEHGIMGIILAKILAIICGQLGLFWLVAKKVSTALKPNFYYSISQLIVVIPAIILIYIDDLSIFFRMVIGLFILFLSSKIYNLNISTIKSLVGSLKNK